VSDGACIEFLQWRHHRATWIRPEPPNVQPAFLIGSLRID
jgi:hypothetical protein